MKFQKTKMTTLYFARFIFRICAFLTVFSMYIYNKPFLWGVITGKIVGEISIIHLLWAAFMIIMISHLFPNERRSMALRKGQEKNYYEKSDYSELELLRFVKIQNINAWRVMLVWLSFNAIFGILYLFGKIDEADLFMLTVFFFLCDYICILFFCPFQTFIMKNKCCINCRIYDWGHFMMFTPMLFIRNFFSWSLFFTSIIVMIHWEIGYSKHPERFWSGSNKTLQCINCKDKTCQAKRAIARNKIENDIEKEKKYTK